MLLNRGLEESYYFCECYSISTVKKWFLKAISFCLGIVFTERKVTRVCRFTSSCMWFSPSAVMETLISLKLSSLAPEMKCEKYSVWLVDSAY